MRITLFNILLSIVILVAILVFGIGILIFQSEVELQKSSYTLTEYDYTAISPSVEQVKTWESYDDVQVFPSIRLKDDVQGNKTSEITILISNQIDNSQIGLLNSKTLKKGEYKSGTIALDETACNLLGVDLGDTVKVTILNKTYEFELSAIYYAVSYPTLDKGLGMLASTGELESVLQNVQYDIAFLKVGEKAPVDAIVNDYKPLALLTDKDTYIADYKENYSRPSYMTEEEWNQFIDTKYEKYYNDFMDIDYSDYIQSKVEKYSKISNVIDINQGTVDGYVVLISIIPVVVMVIIGSILLFMRNTTDINSLKQGVDSKHLLRRDLIILFATTLAVILLALIGYLITTSQIIASSTYVTQIVAMILPLLANLVIGSILIFVRMRYLTSKVQILN